MPTYSKKYCPPLSEDTAGRICQAYQLGERQAPARVLAQTAKSELHLLSTDKGKFVFKLFSPEVDNQCTLSMEDTHSFNEFCFRSGLSVIEPVGEIQNYGNKKIEVTRFIEHQESPTISVQMVRELGAEIARFHLKARDFTLPVAEKGPTATANRALGEFKRAAKHFASGEPMQGLFYASTLLTAAADLKLHSKLHRNLPKGIIHADMNPNNVLFTPAGKPVLIDFDRVREGVFMEDMSQLISVFCVNKHQKGTTPPRLALDREKLTAFVQGYNDVRPLERSEVDALSDAIYRRTSLMNLGKRSLQLLASGQDNTGLAMANLGKLRYELKKIDFHSMVGMPPPPPTLPGH